MWGQMVHLTPMPRQITDQYGARIYDVDTQSVKLETTQVGQALGRYDSRSDLTCVPHLEISEPRPPQGRHGPQPVVHICYRPEPIRRSGFVPTNLVTEPIDIAWVL